jgi:hypothetical protein
MDMNLLGPCPGVLAHEQHDGAGGVVTSQIVVEAHDLDPFANGIGVIDPEELDGCLAVLGPEIPLRGVSQVIDPERNHDRFFGFG